MRRWTQLFPFLLILASPIVAAAPSETPDLSAYRSWIVEMKSSESGPFSGIRWFCNDGTVMPPKAFACSSHGGGYQHGKWSKRTSELREQGFQVATLLAGVDPEKLLAGSGAQDALAGVLIERYLISADDGWIFRRALFYRGAVQEEDERAGARALLTKMVSRLEWLVPRYAQLRVAARLLPHGEDSASVQKVRQMSASLSDRDGGFIPLRAKIHGAPGEEDADRVRAYAAGLGSESERRSYLELADEIDRIYQAAPLEQDLEATSARYTEIPWLQQLLNGAANRLREEATASNRFFVTSDLLYRLRDALLLIRPAEVRLEILDLGLRVESHNFRASTELRKTLRDTTRFQRLEYLQAAGKAAYGAGVINARLLGQLSRSVASLGTSSIGLGRYLEELRYIGRAPAWGTQNLRMHFYGPMEKMARIEPMAMLFIQDQLRGSPLMFFSSVLDGLSRDASRLAGVEHRLFGEAVGVGFTALNPGLATGILHVEPDLGSLESFHPDGIYLLPETVSELPPVAGILTEGEGNPLSHIQLLARNLGIPNVTVDSSMSARLAAHHDERIVLAVSKSGLVELSAWDENWNGIFNGAGGDRGVRIEPDLGKLDLSVKNLVSLDDLRASDSGRTVGPKAAKLGELRAIYPGHVSRGIAIPFGMFRQEVLEQPHPGGAGTIFDWMVENYRQLASIPANDPHRAAAAEAFRAKLYDTIINAKPSEGFKQKLEAAMKDTFGLAPPGVFVRSDTNVEDLAGFTGAGLNLTLPNVVGFDNLVEGISRVWASPFTARAFAWRQSHMTQPEHVYTSILLLESVGSDKSGVLVTQDIDTGSRDFISVAVNEGLGGAVDGQAAESLRIPMDGSQVRVLATATAPWRRVPDPAGGLQLQPSSGGDTVLQPGEITQLIEFAKGLPEKFPAITDDEGNPAPADVEFGFIDGDLRLFQLRPFLESKMARDVGYLREMDARLAGTEGIRVDLKGVPQ